jgi:alpha-tubulin suppressor-like RCC1 family protein
MHTFLSSRLARATAPRRPDSTLLRMILRVLGPTASGLGERCGTPMARRAVRRALAGLALAAAACADQPTAPAAPEAPGAPGAPRAYLAAVPSTVTYTQVSASWTHSCAVGTGGGVTCWGDNSFGQSAVPAAAQSGVTQVSTGPMHTCAVGSGGAVLCWGNDSYGQSTVPLAAQSGVTQVSVGQGHSCALAGGAVTCWGLNSDGQTSVPAAARSGVTQISAGWYNVCAVVGAGGTVTCWGSDVVGESTPPAGLSGVTQVSAADHHSCAVATAGTVVCWGEFEPPPAGLSGVTQVSTGLQHTCATGGAGTGGTVTCWGRDDSHGQLTPPAGLTGVTHMSAGLSHTCAVAGGGSVSCWGNDSYGQSTVPVPTMRVLPTATFSAPGSVVMGEAVALTLTNAQVPGYAQATAFTYAFDCGTGTYGAASSVAGASCPTTTAGLLTVRGKVIDQDGDVAEYTASVTVSAPATALSPAQATAQLRGLVASAPISAPVRDGFTATLDAASAALAHGNARAACNQLRAFQLQVQAQRGKAIPSATADGWLMTAGEIRGALGC